MTLPANSASNQRPENYSPIVLGIDPGYDRVGWAVGRKNRSGSLDLLGYGCVQTSAKDHIFKRYSQIYAELDTVICKYQPTQGAIESLFFEKNQKTAMRVSEARGLIISCMLTHGIEVMEYTPLQVKQGVTGYGTADKQAVQKMVFLQLPELKSVTKKLLDDVTDAVGICLTQALSR